MHNLLLDTIISITWRCPRCEGLNVAMTDLAETLNEMEDETVALAKVDCSTERAICPGKHHE